MSFEPEEEEQMNSGCFFTKLLQECSRENPEGESGMRPETHPFHSESLLTHRDRTSNLENWLWTEQDILDEDQEQEEDNFERAKSLRV